MSKQANLMFEIYISKTDNLYYLFVMRCEIQLKMFNPKKNKTIGRIPHL